MMRIIGIKEKQKRLTFVRSQKERNVSGRKSFEFESRKVQVVQLVTRMRSETTYQCKSMSHVT